MVRLQVAHTGRHLMNNNRRSTTGGQLKWLWGPTTGGQGDVRCERGPPGVLLYNGPLNSGSNGVLHRARSPLQLRGGGPFEPV